MCFLIFITINVSVIVFPLGVYMQSLSLEHDLGGENVCFFIECICFETALQILNQARLFHCTGDVIL